MPTYWKCTQCGTLQEGEGFFTAEPTECDVCGNMEFRTIGREETGIDPLSYFTVENAVRVMVGLIVLNIIAGVLGAVVPGLGAEMLAVAAVSVAVLGGLAYGLAAGSRIAWLASVALVGMGFVGAVFAGLAGQVGGDVLLVIFGAVGGLVYLVLLAMLLGGWRDVWETEEAQAFRDEVEPEVEPE